LKELLTRDQKFEFSIRNDNNENNNLFSELFIDNINFQNVVKLKIKEENKMSGPTLIWQLRKVDFKNLKQLIVIGGQNYFLLSAFEKFFEMIPKLEVFKIKNLELGISQLNMLKNKLKRLDMQNVHQLDILQSIFNSLQSGSYENHRKLLDYYRDFSQFKSLDFDFGENCPIKIRDELLMNFKLFDKFPMQNLKILNISNCLNLNHLDFVQIMQKLKCLEKLIMVNLIYLFTKETIMSLETFEEFRNTLKYLDISSSKKETYFKEDLFDKFINLKMHLNYLNMQGIILSPKSINKLMNLFQESPITLKIDLYKLDIINQDYEISVIKPYHKLYLNNSEYYGCAGNLVTNSLNYRLPTIQINDKFCKILMNSVNDSSTKKIHKIK